jgi:hypothetical protein
MLGSFSNAAKPTRLLYKDEGNCVTTLLKDLTQSQLLVSVPDDHSRRNDLPLPLAQSSFSPEYIGKAKFWAKYPH